MASLLRFTSSRIRNLLAGNLAKDGMRGLLARVLAVGSGFVSSVVLARTLGSAEYGVYAFVLGVIGMISLPVQMGLPTLIVRETAQSVATHDWPRLRGIWHWAGTKIISISLIMIVSIGIWLLIKGKTASPREAALLWGLPLVPLLALGAARSAALRGLRRVFLATLPEDIIWPLGVAALTLLAFWLLNRTLTAEEAFAASSVSALLAFFVGAFALIHSRPAELRAGSQERRLESRRWLQAIIPLSIASGLGMIRSTNGILLLGLMRSDTEVGLYRVALSISTISMFCMTTLNAVLQPHIAALYSRNETVKLQRITSLASSLTLASTLAITLVTIVAGRFLLELFYGADFSDAYWPLIILIMSTLLNATFGVSGVLLSMTGNEKSSMHATAVSVAVQVALSLILIPTFGTKGAATATAITTGLWVIHMYVLAMKKTGIDATPFALLKSKRRRQ